MYECVLFMDNVYISALLGSMQHNELQTTPAEHALGFLCFSIFMLFLYVNRWVFSEFYRNYWNEGNYKFYFWNKPIDVNH